MRRHKPDVRWKVIPAFCGYSEIGYQFYFCNEYQSSHRTPAKAHKALDKHFLKHVKELVR